jgi:glutathione S-transferase
MSLVLYGAKESGHAFKTRMFLLLADVPHQYRAVDIELPRDQRPADFQAVAAYGEVPVLIDEGRPYVQSNNILLHLAEKFGRFGAGDGVDWPQIRTWLFWEANRIGRSYPHVRWFRHLGRPGDPGLIAWFEETARLDLARLDRELADRPFLLGRLTIADLSCAGYLIYGDDSGLNLAQWGNVMRWLDRIRSQPGWRAPRDVMG